MLCKVCMSTGFDKSKSGPGCEFCDGTEGGQIPSKHWYFTFGHGTNLKNNYVCVVVEPTEEDPSGYGTARKEMVEHHGTNWAFQYDWEVFEDQIKRFGLTAVPIGTTCGPWDW